MKNTPGIPINILSDVPGDKGDIQTFLRILKKKMNACVVSRSVIRV